ncbi:MAG: DNA polymerase beta superfamily protein [Muribaculaceae bacterium]
MKLLHKLEEQYKIKILMAVNSGSRSFGYSSAESDWDVRLIYVHRPEWYFSINKTDDVIELMLEEEHLDIEGYDLKKALSLLTKTNPILSDWLHSKDVFIVDEKFLESMHQFERMCYNTKNAMYHFYSISANNKRYLDEEATLKRFIYYMRGLLACRWIENTGNHPPVKIDELIDATITDNDAVRQAAHELLALKRQGKVHDKDIVTSGLVEYIFEMQKYYMELLPNLTVEKPVFAFDELSKFLMDTVMGNNWQQR